MTDEVPKNDIDFLMSLNPLDYKPGDIDVIIAYQRKYRQQLEGGVKPPRGKAKAASVGGKINLAELMNKAVKPIIVEKTGPTLPSTSGVRRI